MHDDAVHHLAAFADPWEQVRLLADTDRTEALIRWLVEVCPGRTMLGAGCGTGLLSMVAARAGARRVL